MMDVSPSEPLGTLYYLNRPYAYDSESRMWISFKTMADALLARLTLMYGVRRYEFDVIMHEIHDVLNAYRSHEGLTAEAQKDATSGGYTLCDRTESLDGK